MSSSNDLLQLMTELVQFHDQQSILRHFIIEVNRIFPKLEAEWMEANMSQQVEGKVVADISTKTKSFGQIAYYPNTSAIQENNFQNALQLLTVFLARLDQQQRNYRESRLEATLHEQIAALRESEQTYRTIFENTGNATVMIDEHKIITLANEEFTKLSGYSKKEIEGKLKWTEFVHEDDLGFMQEQHNLRREDGSKALNSYEFHFLDRKGKIHNIHLIIGIVPGTKRSIASLIDITERIIVEQKLKKYRDYLEQMVEERTSELKKSNEDLEAFAYSVSHDLRAPLRHINGFMSILREKISIDDSEVDYYFKKVNDASHRMQMLINDLLEFSRIGRNKIHLARLDLNPIINRVIRNCAAEIPEREVQWEIGRFPVIKADPNLLEMVFNNLVSNALKFTSQREKALIAIDSNTDTPGKVVIYIRDNGVGFDPKYSEKIFGVFQRLHSDEEYPGTGIGLANTRRIINLHGGTIKAEADIGKGATFFITLPLREH